MFFLSRYFVRTRRVRIYSCKMSVNILSNITATPQHCFTLHAPASIITKYIRCYLYSFFFERGIFNEAGYVQEEFEGKLMHIPQDTVHRSHIESCITDIQALVQDQKTLMAYFFVNNKESHESVEHWIFQFNAKYDVEQHSLPTLDDIILGMISKVSYLPKLGVPCTLDAYLMKRI